MYGTSIGIPVQGNTNSRRIGGMRGSVEKDMEWKESGRRGGEVGGEEHSKLNKQVTSHARVCYTGCGSSRWSPRKLDTVG